MDGIIGLLNPTKVGNLNRMNFIITGLEAANQVQLRLVQSVGPMTDLSTLATVTEATYSGYQPKAITDWLGAFLDVTGAPYSDAALQVFQCTGAGVTNTIYGAVLTVSTGAAATATGAETGGVVDDITVTAGGTGYQSVPRVVITDATIGTGATAHAVLTAGVVTSIVIDDGGTGYTGPIVTIDRPAAMAAFVNFDTPRPMILSTDAIAVVPEINND